MLEDHAARVWDGAHLRPHPAPPPKGTQPQEGWTLCGLHCSQQLSGSRAGVWKGMLPPTTTCRPRTGHSYIGAVISLETHFRVTGPVGKAVRGQRVAGGWAWL